MASGKGLPPAAARHPKIARLGSWQNALQWIRSYGEHFFHFTGTKLLKITTKWPPAQIEPQKCILNFE